MKYLEYIWPVACCSAAAGIVINEAYHQYSIGSTWLGVWLLIFAIVMLLLLFAFIRFDRKVERAVRDASYKAFRGEVKSKPRTIHVGHTPLSVKRQRWLW